MARLKQSMAELLAGHTDAPYDPEHREFIEDVADALYDRHKDFSRWPECVQDFFACYDLNYQVLDGGWSQVVYNVPELIRVGEKAFERLDCPVSADLCRQVFSRLPSELVTHLAKGNTGTYGLKFLNDFDFNIFDDLDEKVTPEFYVDDKLQELVERHRSDFESVDHKPVENVLSKLVWAFLCLVIVAGIYSLIRYFTATNERDRKVYEAYSALTICVSMTAVFAMFLYRVYRSENKS